MTVKGAVRMALVLAVAVLAAGAIDGPDVEAQRGAPPPAQPPLSPRAMAPVDLTGTWVSIVSEDWRWRMMTPAKGDYASVPLNDAARKAADAWSLAEDEASGNACKPFGVGNIMRMPGRMRISWQDDRTLKIEFDAGTQTRLLHFSGAPPASAERTWQGHSTASWVIPAAPGGRGRGNVDRNNIPQGPSQPADGTLLQGGERPRYGSLKVVTTHMRAGHLRKNGIPYSENAVITEHFDRISYPNGDTVLVVQTVIEDPTYLTLPYITSPNFRLERDDSRFRPTPCRVDPPVVRPPA